jgi:hypothetical protein
MEDESDFGQFFKDIWQLVQDEVKRLKCGKFQKPGIFVYLNFVNKRNSSIR